MYRNAMMRAAICAASCLLVASAASAQSAPSTPGAPPSLDQLLRHAERHAPAMQVARARLELSREARGAARPRVPSNPRLRISAGPRWAGGVAGSDYDLQLSIQQQIQVVGVRRSRLLVAELNEATLAAELEATRWAVHQEVHATYHLALVANGRLDVTRRLLAFQELLREATRRRVAAGDASPIVERIAEVDVAQARQIVLAAEQERRALGLRLAETTGWPPEHPLLPEGAPEPPRDLPDLDALRVILHDHQPELAARRARAEEASSRMRLARRESRQRPTFGLGANREGAPVGIAEWILLGSLTVPLAVAQRNQGGIGAAEGRHEVADAEARAFEGRLDARLRLLLSEVETAAARARVYSDEVLPRFEESLELLGRAFELGEIDLIELSVARDRLLRAELGSLDAQASYFTSLAALEAFLGTHPWERETHHEETSR